jgi:hypothetical protein
MSAARRAWCQEGKVTATGPAPRDVMSTEVLTGRHRRPIPKRPAGRPMAGRRTDG